MKLEHKWSKFAGVIILKFNRIEKKQNNLRQSETENPMLLVMCLLKRMTALEHLKASIDFWITGNKVHISFDFAQIFNSEILRNKISKKMSSIC